MQVSIYCKGYLDQFIQFVFQSLLCFFRMSVHCPCQFLALTIHISLLGCWPFVFVNNLHLKSIYVNEMLSFSPCPRLKLLPFFFNKRREIGSDIPAILGLKMVNSPSSRREPFFKLAHSRAFYTLKSLLQNTTKIRFLRFSLSLCV